MKKQLSLLITLCAHTALFPMVTSSLKNTRLLVPLLSSYQRTTMLPVACASSRALSALDEQIVACKKLHHELTEKEKKLAEACKVQDTYQSAKYFTCFFFVLRLIGDAQWGNGMGCVMDVVDCGVLAGMFHCADPQEQIDAFEKDRKRMITELACKKSNVIEPLIQSIEQDACDGRGNPELYDSMRMIRTAMKFGKSESNLKTEEKHD